MEKLAQLKSHRDSQQAFLKSIGNKATASNLPFIMSSHLKNTSLIWQRATQIERTGENKPGRKYQGKRQWLFSF